MIKRKGLELAPLDLFDSYGIIITFLISVLASVAGYYICKWLGRD